MPLASILAAQQTLPRHALNHPPSGIDDDDPPSTYAIPMLRPPFPRSVPRTSSDST
jgi:hypothetical protein